MTIYQLHQQGDCNGFTCPICAQEEAAPVLCDWHRHTLAQLATEEKLLDDELADTAAAFARICNDCEAPR